MTATKARPLTRTADREPGTDRKRVYANRGDVSHRWAANNSDAGRAGNLFFRYGTIYSYGEHFPIARHVVGPNGRRFVLFTSEGYSSTTAGHKSITRRAIPNDVDVYTVADVMADTRDAHRNNFRTMREEVAELLGKAKRARANKAYLLESAANTIRRANEYAEAVGLRERITGGSDAGSLDALLAAIEAERAQAAKAEAVRGRKRERERAAKLAAATAEWEQKLAAWQDGGEWPGYHPAGRYAHPYAYLRVRGSRLETSERAVVPLAAALPVLAHIRTGEPLPEGFGIDGFMLSEVDREARTVRIGCHTVTFDEVERLAAKEGL